MAEMLALFQRIINMTWTILQCVFVLFMKQKHKILLLSSSSDIQMQFLRQVKTDNVKLSLSYSETLDK